MNWIGRISPDDVTVDRSSFFVSSLTTVTSGVSVRVARTLPTMMIANKAIADTPMMIFFLRLNAIIYSYPRNWLLLFPT